MRYVRTVLLSALCLALRCKAQTATGATGTSGTAAAVSVHPLLQSARTAAAAVLSASASQPTGRISNRIVGGTSAVIGRYCCM